VGEVCSRLDESSDSILKISEDCGFTSLRSMNRNFKARTGMTPVEYRHRKK
jgi:AraC-like DNA-binding protein